MPWSTTASELCIAFVHVIRTAGRSVSQAVWDFWISRKPAYTWLALFGEPNPLAVRSYRPKRSHNRTSDELE